jgi:hypothetical protein
VWHVIQNVIPAVFSRHADIISRKRKNNRDKTQRPPWVLQVSLQSE